MVKPVILQVAGYHNSGKTAFIQNLLSMLKQKGYRTVTLKHHGHGGKPDIVEETDSARHISAGALASLVDGGGRLLLQTEQIEWSLNQKLGLLVMLQPDLIIIEGYKHEEYQKVVFIRDDDDLMLLDQLTNIQFVLYKDKPPKRCQYQSFHRSDDRAIECIVDFLTAELNKQKEE
ncbi:molybdopterin-guanine dinucleotide biosynthesis protein B [Bacillus tuaregi]|uniref:molybdopterin-guanine dinucleotide biosynthesis protein B n=1 Tax=Bacillus tuaregi TaxID=1816695 RepID=UPI0036F1BB5B